MSAVPHISPAKLRLADHVQTCIVDDQVVLLDLRRSRYLGLSRRQWQHVAVLIGLTPGDGTRRPDDADMRSLVDPLVRQRILTSQPGTPARVAHLPTPAASLDVRSELAASSLRLQDVWRFVYATSLAALWLRFRSLHAISGLLEARLQACAPRGPDRAALTQAVAAFERLRPLAFSSKDQCLFDSLALTLFLTGQRIAVQWVIGVAARPFEAHSWVQDGSEVLNDLHENVARFTPLHVV